MNGIAQSQAGLRRAPQGTVTLGFVTVGQTPRPDLSEWIREITGRDYPMAGALDGLTRSSLSLENRTGSSMEEGPPVYALLSTGDRAEVPAQQLLPRIRKAVQQLSEIGCTHASVLCSVPFDRGGYDFELPTLFPADFIPPLVARFVGTTPVGVVVPVAGQVDSARRHWLDCGVDVTVEFAPPSSPSAVQSAVSDLVRDGADVTILDCFSYGGHEASVARDSAGPVVLTGRSIVGCVIRGLLASGHGSPGSRVQCRQTDSK